MLSQKASDGNTVYDLKKKKENILPVHYSLTINKKVKVMAFYADHNIFLYEMNGTLPNHRDVEFLFDKYAYVKFKPVNVI